MLGPEAGPVHGLVDPGGHLISADEALADLHMRAGGEPGGALAVPQLAALARLVRRLAIPVSRAVLAADGDTDLDLWVRARPQGEDIALAIAGWTPRPAAAALPETPGQERERDFLRADADWTWEADAALRLTALSSDGLKALRAGGATAMLGEPMARLFVLEEAPRGGLPLLEALAGNHGFDDQMATLRGSHLRFRLAAIPLSDPLGRLTGFRGGGFRLAPEVLPVAEVASPPPVDTTAFARRLDGALRAPLNRIVATAEQIREQDAGPVRADYNAYAGDIANAGRHLLGLIGDLVDLEAVERADLAVDRETLDLADVARRAAGLLAVRADDRNMRIEQPDFSEKAPAIGDFRRSLQVLVNLVGNAVRYGPQGSTVRVSAEMRDGHTAIVVADEGRGVAPEDRERVFEKFERLGAREPGSGLGLYISRRLARAMGGDIAIESGAGEGARFVFTLPVA